jgi:hypothetical protein
MVFCFAGRGLVASVEGVTITKRWPNQWRTIGCAILFAGLFSIQSAKSIEVTELSGAAHGYPAMRDLNGKILGEAEFLQWAEGNRLRVKLIYRLKNHRRIEENDVFRQRPELIQEQYSWRETANGQVVREFKMNFGTMVATAQKLDNGEVKHWEEKLEIEPGKTFAGFGFSLALQNLRTRLLKGEHVELKGIGFKPKPAMLAVEISHAGLEKMEMAGRFVRGDHFVIHPKVPVIAKLFIKIPDFQVWLTNPAPAGFLRWEAPIAEPNDPMVRVDLLSGDGSGPAQPLEDQNSRVAANSGAPST